jgi:hypothetical protein
MTDSSTSRSERPDAAYAVLHELERFVTQANLKATRDEPDESMLYGYSDGTLLKTGNRAVVDPKIREFIRRSAELTESLSQHGRLMIGPAGSSVDGNGLERVLISYELASRYGEQNLGEWVKGSSEWQRDIAHILSFFSQMAQRRYEKSTAQMTVAYYPKAARAGIGYGQLGKPLLDEYKALVRLCRDAHTVLVVHRGSVISGLLAGAGSNGSDAENFSNPPIQPRLRHLRNLPMEDDLIPIVFNLNMNGSMEILAKSELAFRRVNNVWRFTNLRGALAAIRSELAGDSENPEVVAHNFLALALDLADRGEGALLFLCNEPTTEILDGLFESHDGIIRTLPGLPYQELSARTRFTQLVGQQRLTLREDAYRQLNPLLRDVCSIDGATVFSYRGDLLGFGCIVSLSSATSGEQLRSRPEGARSAAAKAISTRGVAIKVSSDGDATLFLHGRQWGTFC